MECLLHTGPGVQYFATEIGTLTAGFVSLTSRTPIWMIETQVSSGDALCRAVILTAALKPSEGLAPLVWVQARCTRDSLDSFAAQLSGSS